MYDEGPSPEDIERFGRQTAYCPECGAEIWDAAPRCPKCGSFMPEGPVRHSPLEMSLNRKVMIAVAVAALVGFLLLAL